MQRSQVGDGGLQKINHMKGIQKKLDIKPFVVSFINHGCSDVVLIVLITP